MADANIDRVLGWDDTIENDSTGFVLLPEGDYTFTVTGFERAYHNGSDNLPACPKAVLTIELDGGAKGKATIKQNLFMHSRVEGKLCAFFTAIGHRKHGEPLRMDWSRVLGATGSCHVAIRKWTSKTGEQMESNEIKRFIEPIAAPTATYKPGSF